MMNILYELKFYMEYNSLQCNNDIISVIYIILHVAFMNEKLQLINNLPVILMYVISLPPCIIQ